MTPLEINSYLTDPVISSRVEVYPGYIGMRIKKALVAADSEQIIKGIGDMETIGDCRYQIPVTDFNGTRYKITIEVA